MDWWFFYGDQVRIVLYKKQEKQNRLRVCVVWVGCLSDYLYMVQYSHTKQTVQPENIMDKSNIDKDAQVNIKDLAEYLKQFVGVAAKAQRISGVERDFIGFDISQYFEEHEKATKYECGATACAVGHYAIMRGFRIIENGVRTEPHGGYTWKAFSECEIGIKPTGKQALIWDWLFNGGWAECDNTPLGVVARIEVFLDRGVPEYFVETWKNYYSEEIANSPTPFNDYSVEQYQDELKALESEFIKA